MHRPPEKFNPEFAISTLETTRIGPSCGHLTQGLVDYSKDVNTRTNYSGIAAVVSVQLVIAAHVFLAFKQVRDPLQNQLVLADLPKSPRGCKMRTFPSQNPALIPTADQARRPRQDDDEFAVILKPREV